MPYAVIGGVALQVHQREPRTTLDIDIAIVDRRAIPRGDLETHGLRHAGSFAHSENYESADGVPAEFRDDPLLAPAIARADTVDLAGNPLRVLRRADLLREKLRAGSDPARRRSKRIQDLADAQALIEADAALAAELSPEERERLARLLD